MRRKKDKRNEALARFMVALRIPPHRIRRAIHQVVGVPHKDIAQMMGDGYRSQVSGNITGERSERHVQEAIAKVWQIPREVIFPDER